MEPDGCSGDTRTRPTSDGVRFGVEDLQGAIIDAQRAVQLATLLGVVVK